MLAHDLGYTEIHTDLLKVDHIERIIEEKVIALAGLVGSPLALAAVRCRATNKKK